MDTLAALDMLVRSAETRSFSGAARQLGLTPAAVSKQVAKLERELDLQLVLRTTRSLSLTEAGQRLVTEAMAGLHAVRSALQAAQQRDTAVSGVLRLSVAPAFGRQYVLPAMAPLLAAHPALQLDWQFDNRQVDLIGEGLDAGIAGGVDIANGLVARPLVPLHVVPVAAPGLLKSLGVSTLKAPAELEVLPALMLRSSVTGRERPWVLQKGTEAVRLSPRARCWFNDPEAVKDAALAGLGVAMCGLTHVHEHLRSGALVRLLPGWWNDLGAISLYFPTSRLMPVKTRVFVDHLVGHFQRTGLARAVSAGR